MPTQVKKVRWGVLGYARIARESLIPAIQRSSRSEFHALASRDPAKLAEGQTRFNVPKTYGAYDRLLADPEIDAVYIPLPNSLHCEWTIKAAESGKHILCEKPLALNAAECRRMIAACAANKVILMEAFMYRYTDRTRKVLEVLQSGVLGDIRFISSTFRFPLTNPASIKLKAELGGGSLYDVGCYPINFAGMVVDQIARGQSGQNKPDTMPESFSAQCMSVNGIDTIFSALLKYPSGLIASLNSGFNAQKQVCSQIVGTKGLLEIPDTFFGNAGALTLTIGEEQRSIEVELSDRYGLEVEDFASAILDQRTAHCRLDETVRNAQVMDELLALGR